MWLHVAELEPFVNVEHVMDNTKEDPTEAEEGQMFGDEDDQDTLEWAEEETKEAKPERAKSKRKPRASSKSQRAPLQKRPFHIMRFNTDTRKYEWLDLWDHKTPPTPGQVRDAFGPGRYELRDAEKNVERWEIGPDPNKAAGPAQQNAEPAAPPLPPRIAPAHEHQELGTHPNPYAAHPGSYAPPMQTSGPDPQMMSTFYRLDAAIQQISADCRRLQDELRSVTYELQQVPMRVSERVAAAIKDSADPFDQMGRVWEMSQKLAEGVGPNEDKGPGMAEMVAAIAGALAPNIAGAPAAPLPPEMAQSSPHTLPAPPNGNDEEHQELPGMTPAIRQELVAHARAKGVTYQDAIGLALRQGWDAQTLLTAARSTAPAQKPPAEAPP